MIGLRVPTPGIQCPWLKHPGGTIMGWGTVEEAEEARPGLGLIPLDFIADTIPDHLILVETSDMTYFKVRNKRNDDGSYTLSYGKGAGKLEAIMVRDGNWAIQDEPSFGTHAKMADCKEAWGGWAVTAYGGASNTSAAPALAETTPAHAAPSAPKSGPPKVPPRAMPPSAPAPTTPPKAKKSAPPSIKKLPPKVIGPQINVKGVDFKSPRFSTEKGLTPLGLAARVICDLGDIRPPTEDEIQSVVTAARAVLARECPDLVIAPARKVAAVKSRTPITEADIPF
jgi:hypothetical protein